MARGLDKENTPSAPPRRNPFRQEIIRKEDPSKLVEEEGGAQPGEALGSDGHRLFYLDDGVVLETSDPEGYRCYELLDKQGREVFYSTEEGLEQGSRPTIVKERETDRGSEKQEVWLKKNLNIYQVDYRRELRNKDGNLHSPDPETPAFVLKRYRGNSVVREASFFNDGVLLKRIVYSYAAFSETGMGDTIEVFDGNGNLHSFDGLPARFFAHDSHEFYEHGRLQESSGGEYTVFKESKRLFPEEEEIREVAEYISRLPRRKADQERSSSYYNLLQREDESLVTPEQIMARRESLKKARTRKRRY